MSSTRTVAVLVVSAALVVVTAGAATAGWLITRDDTVGDRGTCHGFNYELSVEHVDGRHEVSFELQSAAPGETWTVVVGQGGTTLLSSERTTDEDGEIDVDVLADPEAGDRIAVAATRGERLCSAATGW